MQLYLIMLPKMNWDTENNMRLIFDLVCHNLKVRLYSWTHQISDFWYERIMLTLTWKPLPWDLAPIVAVGALAREKNNQYSYTAVTSMSHNNEKNLKIPNHEVVPIVSYFLISFASFSFMVLCRPQVVLCIFFKAVIIFIS